jgi:hypothetical protein
MYREVTLPTPLNKTPPPNTRRNISISCLYIPPNADSRYIPLNPNKEAVSSSSNLKTGKRVDGGAPGSYQRENPLKHQGPPDLLFTRLDGEAGEDRILICECCCGRGMCVHVRLRRGGLGERCVAVSGQLRGGGVLLSISRADEWYGRACEVLLCLGKCGDI